jgi:hypothetical protein
MFPKTKHLLSVGEISMNTSGRPVPRAAKSSISVPHDPQDLPSKYVLISTPIVSKIPIFGTGSCSSSDLMTSV